MRLSPHVSDLICLRCGQVYPPSEGNGVGIRYQCQCRSNRLSDVGTLDVRYRYDAIAREASVETTARDPDRSMGRFHYLLPFRERTHLPPVSVGDTPLLDTPRLASQLGLQRLLIKDEGRQPSGSLKDRASAIGVAIARENGYAVVATASTGNAAAALAGQSAAAGRTSVIFVPQSAPPAKVAQLLIFGSHVLIVDGSYDQAFDLCTEACHTFGWFNRNTGLNPYMTEGKKTVAYEIALQLGETHRAGSGSASLTVPDVIVVSVGDGSIIGGVHKGFSDLIALGWTEKVPRIYGVQSEQSSALANAWRRGAEFPDPVVASTRADSIKVNAPRDPIKALNAVRQTEGAFITIPDSAILAAMPLMARLGGVFGEPAGAAALAGLQKAVREKWVVSNELIVVINTGSGLKDVNAAMQATGGARVIEPNLNAVVAAVEQSGIPV